MRFRVGRHETDGRAAFAGAARAADAVRVVDGRAGQVIVDDGRQAGDVDAARRHVGGHQHLQAARLEVGQQLAARALAEFTVEGAHVQARALQLVGHVFGRVLGGDEHQHALPLLLQDQVAQQLRAARHVDRDGALHDVGLVLRFGRHLDAHGLLEQAVGQRLHAVGEGGGEEQVLPLLGQQRQDGVDFLAESPCRADGRPRRARTATRRPVSRRSGVSDRANGPAWRRRYRRRRASPSSAD